MMRRIVMGLVVGGFFLAPAVAGAVVDPACFLQAKNDYVQCKSDCRDTFRDDKFRCRNVQPACGNACLAGRERCLDPYLQVLTDCVDGCDATLQQGKQDLDEQPGLARPRRPLDERHLPLEREQQRFGLLRLQSSART